jgi:hypothetical protein
MRKGEVGVMGMDNPGSERLATKAAVTLSQTLPVVRTKEQQEGRQSADRSGWMGRSQCYQVSIKSGNSKVMQSVSQAFV